MKKVAQLLNAMLENNIVNNYALFGAMAQMRYTEAVATMDADFLVALPEEGHRLDVLAPIYSFCLAKGYQPAGDAIQVGSWPVQFIPVFDKLLTDALYSAESGQIDGVPIRVVRADFLAAVALSVGRAKDHTRILALLESECVTMADIASLAAQYDLEDRWDIFRRRFIDE